MNPLWRRGWLVEPECVWVIRLPRGGRTPSELYTWSALPHLTMPHAVVLRKSTKQLLEWISPTEQLALTDFLADSNYSPTNTTKCTLHTAIYHCTHCTLEYSAPAQQLLQWTLCSPAENLLLSWLSHSASILTHLNESVSRSSEGGYLPCHHPPVCRWTEHAYFDFW